VSSPNVGSLSAQWPQNSELVKVLVAQRDEHIKQLHATNGQCAILALSLSAGILAVATANTSDIAKAFGGMAEFWSGLLCVGASLFCIGATTSLWALARHEDDRTKAARALEWAVAALIQGRDQQKILVALAKAMKPRLNPRDLDLPSELTTIYPADGDPEPAYLAAEVNPLGWVTTFYQKVFIGCVALVLGSVLLAAALVGSAGGQ
jgi:hypothetical protein